MFCVGCTNPAPAQREHRSTGLDHEGRNSLAAFYEALAEMKNGTAKGPVNTLQIGDSHTANDSFSTRMRELFQARFGDAGRGMLPPGIPFTYYRPSQVTVTADGWRTVGSLDPSNPGPFGLAGFARARSRPPR